MTKSITDFTVIGNEQLSDRYHVILLSPLQACDMTSIRPGQFVQVQTTDTSGTFLRRPISIHDVDVEKNILSLLVCNVGSGTNSICKSQCGDTLNVIWPLGNGFSIPDHNETTVLLMGGGVGVAPLLYLGKQLKGRNITPHFLLAARTAEALLRMDAFAQHGIVDTATDDGSHGHKGLITQHPIFSQHWDKIYCCGPMPMMKAIARECHNRNIDCEVSLENTMACGIGACLCCVEKTTTGNRCVCTDGPVFNINDLTWS
ncbi:MAG: dihydroorotate dehydrogenase electron transfer subunit [Muribaculaceae bacterium]|nr:dihydroorotate dehydrogenase electron transfer subunit [Muribaculaceae bacterium]